MNLYAEIMKTDDEQRMVYGYASTEALDSQGERVSKDAIQAALDDYMKWANIREMHQPSAVGVAKQADIDDKGLYIAAKVVDDDAWKKIKESVYKGFSIGGRTVSKIDGTIKALTLTEISLVDRPANPECKFDVYKAEITKEVNMDKELQTDIKKYTGEEIYDAQTALQALDAVMYLYTKEQAEGHEEAAGQVSDLKTVIDKLKAFIASEVTEDSTVESTAEVVAMAEKTEDVKKKMIAKVSYLTETGEVIKEETLEYEEGAFIIEKAGARNSKTDMEKIQGIHDHAAAMGAKCAEAEKSAGADDIQKVHNETLEKLATTEAELAKVQTENADLKKRVKELEAQPAEPKGALKAVAVDKQDDKGADIQKEEEPKTAQDAIRKAHKMGGVPLTKFY